MLQGVDGIPGMKGDKGERGLAGKEVSNLYTSCCHPASSARVSRVRRASVGGRETPELLDHQVWTPRAPLVRMDSLSLVVDGEQEYSWELIRTWRWGTRTSTTSTVVKVGKSLVLALVSLYASGICIIQHFIVILYVHFTNSIDNELIYYTLFFDNINCT